MRGVALLSAALSFVVLPVIALDLPEEIRDLSKSFFDSGNDGATRS